MNIWEGNYKNFNDAKKFKKGKGFLGRRYITTQLDGLENCKRYLKKKKKIPSRFTLRYKNFLTIVNKYFKNDVKVLDFGGGYGIGYFFLKQNVKKKIDYTILEIPSLVNILNRKKSKIKYIKNLNIKKKFDIINCCSVIQYVDNWKLLIDKLCKTKSNYIYFSDLFSGNINSFVTLQNYYESKIPHWFLNLDEFKKELNIRGYKLISKKKMITTRLNFKTIVPMKNFNYKFRIPHTLNLLFERVTN